MGIIQIINIDKSGKIEEMSFRTQKDFLNKIHNIAGEKLSYVHDNKKLTTDMDGVLIHDDNAIITARIISGPKAQEMYGKYADANIKAVAQGLSSYCWYAPTLFVGQLLQGLSPDINRAVGENVRVIPGSGGFILCIKELGYDITAITAGHQDAAEEVTARFKKELRRENEPKSPPAFDKTIGTELEIVDELYTGKVKKFIGGEHKRSVVDKILQVNGEYRGTHIGDSWSDVETLAAVPNSIAFNPGCELALQNADISIIGTSLFSLLPLFDLTGKYNSHVDACDIPKYIIIRDGPIDPESAKKLLAISKKIKKDEIGQCCDKWRTAENIESIIKSELTLFNVNFKTKFTSFMSVEEFDSYAKTEYAKLRK